LGPVVLATPWPEEHRLRAGWSYEPPTFYEANDAAVALPEVFEEMQLPDGKSNKGRVQAFDGPIYIADAALYLMKADPSLGIKDPYELNDAQYKAALALLRKQRQIVGRYWHDAFVQIDDFTNEGVVASGSWQFQANILKSKNRPIAAAVPEEGVTGWAELALVAGRRRLQRS
jgi:putative spermidine/putrescine transport system substrate-binding protein